MKIKNLKDLKLQEEEAQTCIEVNNNATLGEKEKVYLVNYVLKMRKV